MKKAVLYIHGKGGNAEEAEHYKAFFNDHDVFGLDYKAATPWETREEILVEYERLYKKYDSISIIANSIGAYFTMNALSGKKLERAFFISPIVNTEKLITDMMLWANVTEQELKEKQEIATTQIFYAQEVPMEYKILRLVISATFGDTSDTVYPTLLWDEKNIVLVDCGFIGSLSTLEKELAQYGLSTQQLTGLVLTHHDHDHMGAAAAMKRVNPNIKIYSSQAEAPYISAQEKPLRLKQAEEMQKSLPPDQQDFGRAFCDMLRRVEPVLVDEFIHDGDKMDWCGGCHIIATPGHTPGHISLFMENESIVLTGDAMALEDGKPVIPNPQFTLDLKQADSSMNKLLSLNAKTYYCYHGGVYGRVPDR